MPSTPESMNNYVIMGNMGRGPCDLEYELIRVAVRGKRENAVFIENSERLDGTCGVTEAYDLVSDPREDNNLISDRAEPPFVFRLRNIAEGRCKEVHAS